MLQELILLELLVVDDLRGITAATYRIENDLVILFESLKDIGTPKEY